MTRFFSHIGTRSLVRWVAASLIGAVSVSQALRVLPSLMARSASLGVLALSSLAFLTIAGMASLWIARLRIGRELTAMSQRPLAGELVRARKERLASLAAQSAKPDRAALAEATAAEERGQAYLGRFLVAVAVLIGLVGTFSGLAEALRGLPAILTGAATDPQKLAGLLAAPLGGLDVTFAAGIVGILSTLALALAQGDLQIHEELALARLEEETTHELIPSLWPASHSVEERMLRELGLLREENRGLLVETGTTIGSRLAEASARSTTEVADRLAAAVEQSGKLLAVAVERRFAEQLSALQKTAEAQLAAQHVRSEAILKQLADNSKVLEQRFVAETSAQTAALRDAGRANAAAIETAARAQTQLADDLRSRAEESSIVQAAQLQALQAELASQAALTQHTLTTSAERAHTEATLAWQALRDSLTKELSQERVALVSSVESLRDTLGTQIESASTALSDSASSVVAAMQESGDKAQQQMASLQAAAVEALSRGSLDAQCAVAEAAEQASKALTDGAKALTEAAASELGQTRAALVEAASQASMQLASALATGSEHLETLLATSRADITDTLSTSREAVDRLVTESVGALNASATSLAQSSERLAFVADTLTPQLEALSPELRALGQEVALLGARQQDQDQPLFADELLRLGEGMERLEALVRLAQPSNEGPLSPSVSEGAKG